MTKVSTARRLGAATAFAVAAALAVSCAPDADAAYPGTRGLIAFESRRDGSAFDRDAAEIYLMNGDGRGQVRLTNNDDTDIAPTWSADGTKIAFFSDRARNNRDIYVMNADGTGVKRLTYHSAWDRDPAWSPDGRWIIFTSHRSGDGDLYAVRSTGGSAQRLTRHGGHDAHPAWSPDGRSIAFFSNRSGWDVFKFAIAERDDALVHSKAVRLTNAPGLDFVPNWSPDGRYIAFASGRHNNCDPRPRIDGYGRLDCTEIYVMNADGTNERRLTFSRYTDSEPNWAPDGETVIFYTERDGNMEVYAVELDGSNVRNLSNNPGADYSPDWQPVAP